VLTTLESTLGRSFVKGEVVHTFNDHGDLDVEGRYVKRIEASRIDEDRNIGVVLFKMGLSTGWDCPRAEVMISFRRAQDYTYITQLMGRMLRTPLARRVEKDAALNDVHLFLPHFDKAMVESVIQALKSGEDVQPSETGTSHELITLQRRKGTDDIFEAMKELVTYRVDAAREQSALHRIMGLGRGLTHDRIDENALNQVRDQLVEKMGNEVARLRESGEFNQYAKQVTGLQLNTVAVHSTGAVVTVETCRVDAASVDVDRRFQQAGRLLSNGLHMEYWRAHSDRDVDEVKVEVVALSQDHTAMQSIEQYAANEFDRLYESHRREMASRREERRKHYERLRLATTVPQDIPWSLPDSIPWNCAPTAPHIEQHLYVDDGGNFRVELHPWEREIIEDELQNPEVVGWLRNLDRKPWSLEVPYRFGGTIKPMFPDLVIVRRDATGFLFDILEPHDPSLNDNAAKAVGLAEFAEKHWSLFSRIQLIRKKRAPNGQESYYRLDIGKEPVRRKVLKVNSDSELDEVFDQNAEVG
jgi:type III restriction enzyme